MARNSRPFVAQRPLQPEIAGASIPPTGNLMVADAGTDGFTVSNVRQIVAQNAGQGRPVIRDQGDWCTSGIDCCAGQCVKDPANPGMYICGEPPPPGMCSELGNGCKVAADCCAPSALCIDGYCQLPVPP
ncbi:MAG TPA: hypothetical protein PK156_42100 [Polyangium sp.]|nr:hypothetical protein [Polyangium sp.]